MTPEKCGGVSVATRANVYASALEVVMSLSLRESAPGVGPAAEQLSVLLLLLN